MFEWLKKRRRHQETGASPPLPPCKHVWKDFPWYAKAGYDPNSNMQRVDIYEPYVCASCKKRKDVLLSETVRYVATRDNGDQLIMDITEKYREQIKSNAIVEDMINDFIYVDREKLEFIENLYALNRQRGKENE